MPWEPVLGGSVPTLGLVALGGCPPGPLSPGGSSSDRSQAPVLERLFDWATCDRATVRRCDVRRCDVRRCDVVPLYGARGQTAANWLTIIFAFCPVVPRCHGATGLDCH